jgi:hypothetical protein
MNTAECHPDREEIAIGLCAECLGEELRDQQEEIERAQTRDCSSCGERRGLDQFYGKSAVCKACRRLARYGLTHPGYDILVEEQDGSCAICGASATECVLQVDHDHEADEVRGLLCVAPATVPSVFFATICRSSDGLRSTWRPLPARCRVISTRVGAVASRARTGASDRVSRE